MHPLILFDDTAIRDECKLNPICDLRATFEIRTGALTTGERLVEYVGAHPSGMIVPEGLAGVMAHRHGIAINALPDATTVAGVSGVTEGSGGSAFLLINGRWTYPNQPLPTRINTALVDDHGATVVALLDRGATEAMIASGGALPDGVETAPAPDANLITRPWHVLLMADRNLEHDFDILAKRLHPLQDSPAPRVTVVGEHPVLVGRDTVVHPHVVFDTSAGPIALDDGAEVRSMGVMVGPGYIGRQSVLTNHAHIRAHCVIGPVCKIGGEVNGCVFQGFTNKAHSGYLGNTYVGEWVNLGADTVTSNLKNTYGEIRMQLAAEGSAEPTGQTHLGSIIGDHVKTAIGTRLPTGACVSTGAMLAVGGFPPKFVEAFAFLTDSGVQKYDFDKFCEVVHNVMARRDLKLVDAVRERLRSIY
jgi:UDP-N-acetylglucosamine diphosphorylase/glucosamine-1-phosphate N-acetyltransferase